MDETIAALLGLDLTDPETAALTAATARDTDLVECLVRIRRDQGLTQAQVAERMECSQPNVSAFERTGGDPHLSTIRRYAAAVGAGIHWRAVVEGGTSPITFAPSKVTESRADSFYRRAQ